MEIGIDSFVENTPHPVSGVTISPAERVHDLLEGFTPCGRKGPRLIEEIMGQKKNGLSDCNETD